MNAVEDLGNLIEATTAIPELQFGIVGTDGIAVMGTRGYKKKVGTRRPHGCYFTRPQYLKNVEIIRNPTFTRDCAGCEAVGSCPYSVVLCTPVVKDNRIIGVAGLLGQGGNTNDTVLSSKEHWVRYLSYLANSFASFSQLAGMLEIREMTDEMLRDTFRLSNKQGLIIAGADRRILRLNSRAKSIFGHEPEQVDYNLPLDTLLPKQVLDQLYAHRQEQYSAVMRQNDRLLSLSRADADLLRLINGVAIVMGEEEPAAAQSRHPAGPPKVLHTLDHIIGKDESIVSLKQIILRVADLSLPVLIQGESGTGKELVAQAIHTVGSRASKKMVAVNCAAIPDTLLESELFGYERGAFTGASSSGKRGLFELADGSTLFLDEIGEMSLANQAKLLRVLEQKQLYRLGGQHPIDIDVRIIAATNASLQALVQKKKFREDLFYRLNAVPVHLQTLRRRRGDILLLANYFLGRNLPKTHGPGGWRIDEEAGRVLEDYPWPGNIRELQNAIGYMAAMAKSNVLDVSCLPEHLLQFRGMLPSRSSTACKPTEKEISDALDLFGRSTEGKKKAAEHLGISLPTLYRMIKRFAQP